MSDWGLGIRDWEFGIRIWDDGGAETAREGV